MKCKEHTFGKLFISKCESRTMLLVPVVLALSSLDDIGWVLSVVIVLVVLFEPFR